MLSIGLAACSSNDENSELKVADLTKIDKKFEPDVLWSQSVGDGVDHYYSRVKPVIAYDKVFSVSREGDAYAFDLKTGNTLWHTDLSDLNNERAFYESRKSALINGGPAAGIKKVFMGSENGEVFALSAETGKLDWQGKIKGEVITPPTIDEGILVVNSASGILKAFNASNGEDLWTIEQTVPPLTLRGISAPAVAAGGVIVGSAAGVVNVYILQGGQQGWTAEVGEPDGPTELSRVIDIDSTPLVMGDTVYSISARGHLAAIELRTGRVLWKRKYSSYRQLAVSGNTIFLTDVKGHVYAVDRVNGLEKWSQLLLTNRNVTGPALVGNYIVVGDFEGYLHWIDQESGDIVSRYQVDSSGVYTTPTVDNNILYVQARNGDLEAIATP